MIDTVVLTLNHEDFSIQEPERFNPSARILFSTPPRELGSRGNMSCYQNPTTTELKEGNYKPRLTLNKRIRAGGYAITLKIEFSVPKLIFGNNFDELSDKDFEQVISILYEQLLGMGVFTRREILRNASVSSIHFSKNIILEDFLTSSMMINELKKTDLGKRLDLNKTDYRNGGHAVRYHANSYEIIFYDKVKDMEQAKVSEKRAIEKENLIQFDLFQDIKPRGLEVLRMEVRLGNRVKLKSILKEVDLVMEMSFKNLFQSAVSKKILLHYWEKISKDYSWLSQTHQKPEDIFESVYRQGQTKPLKALQVLGGLKLIESIGMRGFRVLLGKISERTWQRLKKTLENYPKENAQKGRSILFLRDSLVEFLPAKLEGYKNLKFAR